MDTNFSKKDINSDLNQVALSYVSSHYDVKTLSVEEFYIKFLEVRREISGLWGKY